VTVTQNSTSLLAAGPLSPDNPLARPSPLPYGLPDFAAVRFGHLAPAIAAGLAEQRAEWAAVAADQEPPTVENTLEPLERSGRLLSRALAVFFALLGAQQDDDLTALESEVSPALSAHHDAFVLDPALHIRLAGLEEHYRSGKIELDDETAWLLHRYLKEMRRAGVDLGPDEQARLRELNSEITRLKADFRQAVVRGAEAGAVPVADVAELDGLSPQAAAALARNAQDRGREGYLITLKLPTSQVVLESLANRPLRERVLRASLARGSSVDPATDTRHLVTRLVRLRAERAQLLGYAHHAAYVAEDGTAGTTENVSELLERLGPPALGNARAEATDLQAALEVDFPGARLEPWDWAYYSERVRAQRYAVDDGGLRPYLHAERVLRDGVFFAASRLYGISFTERPDLPGHADGVRVFEVHDGDGAGLGIFLLDLYSRPRKRGGAWMSSLVDQSGLLDERPVVMNTLNVDRPPAGQPTLLAWDEVLTLFHEFGHALHGLFSAVRYPSLSGTAVPPDFVEYPSQVNEVWATHPDVLRSYAKHYLTGELLPEETAQRLRAAQEYGEGFRTTEYLAAAVLDQAWHRAAIEDLPTTPERVEEFEAVALERAGVAYSLVPPRYRTTYFNHVFGGGYDAGYYAYIWSEVLDADTVDWFREQDAEHGGLDRRAGDRFRQVLLSSGHAGDPMAAFRALRGRDPVIEPLLKRRGLT
jgi:peptidyl-dipeptidase Dcp